MDALTLTLSTLAKIVFIMVIILTFAPILVWAERRQSAMIQDRIGPVRAGVKIFGYNITLLGLLHPLADALKFIFKEDFVPPKADKFLHAIAPILVVATAILAFAVIPFAEPMYLEHLGQVLPEAAARAGVVIPMQVASINSGILFIFAVAGTGVAGAALAGYASDNKYSLIGGIRAAGQMVSYEVTLGLTIVGCFMVYNTLLLEDMVTWQREHVWGIVAQPVAFILFMTCSIAETKRIPFDIPEGESEIVGGYLTEYSGMKFGMFFMGEFIEVVALAALATTLFFGGYDVPFLTSNGFNVFGMTANLPHVAVVGLQILTFVVKLAVMIWFQLMVRWTLPRFRYDQIMALCWKYILPLSLLNILVTGAIILLLS